MTRVLKFALLLLLALDTAGLAAVSVSVSPSFPQAHPGDQIVFSATVSGTTNSVVIWSLSCAQGGNACGQIRSDGTYTAPPVAPNPPIVTVTATSLADLSQSGSTGVFIGSSFVVGISVAPTSATVLVSHTQKFTATVTNTANPGVTWSVKGNACGGITCGTVTADGTYTAPSSVPNGGLQVTVTARSDADHTRSASASVTIPPVIAVSVSPTNAQIVAGTQQQFTATVTGTNDTGVIWSLSGPGCAGASCGTITQGAPLVPPGLYTAPTTVPTPPQVSITATSVADPTKSSTVVVTILPLAAVNISPGNVQVVAGHTQQFTVTVTNSKFKSVTFSLKGVGCTGSACGTITSDGLYTAPGTVPKPPLVTVTATLVADNTKSASAAVTIVPAVVPIAVTVSPNAAEVLTNGTQQFTATVTGTSNTAVTWTLKGSGCTGSACGTITSGGLYTAPGVVPSPASVTVTATSSADKTKLDTATVTVIPPTVVTISPTSAQVLVGHQQQFTAMVTSGGSKTITWRLLGPGCNGATCGTLSSTGLYTAPAAVPNPPTVTITAILAAEPTKSASATVTIIAPVMVSISPKTAQVVSGHQQQFTATDNGASTSVTWTVKGTGCTGAACGTISTAGLYTAPSAVPNPATVTVTATSTVDTTKSASASVTILPPVIVSVSPATVSIPAGDQQQFTATVTGTNNTSVTWHVIGAGTITAAGLYTAPNTVPNPPQVTIKATSNADNSKSDSAIVTILAPPTVTVLPKTVTVAVNGKQQFHATVVGNSNVEFTWTLSGPGCTGAACGTITAAGLYTAPGSVPNPATVIVKVASQSDPAEAVTANVTIIASDNAKLVGPFAVHFTGFDASGVYQWVGSFTADGAGKITNGLEDINSSAGPQKKIPFTGTYQVVDNNRATLTIDDQFGTRTFKLALNLPATHGRLIEFDDSGIRGSGTIERQDPTAFKTSVFSGGYVMSLAGKDNAGARLAALGVIFSNGAGFISGGSLDVNDGGVISPTFGSFRGTLNVDSTGRGTIALSIPGFEGGTFNFAFYVVSVSKFLMVSVDPLGAGNPIFSGPVELQTGTPFLSSIFKGPAVFSLSGTNGKTPDDMIGRFVFDGISQLTVDLDENNGGKITLDSLFTGAYDVEINGRGTLNLDTSSATGQKTWYVYATGPNRGFVMDGFSSAASIGEIVSQTTAPFSNGDLIGGYLLGSGEPIIATTPLYSGETDFDGSSNPQGKGFVTGIEDISNAVSLLPNQALSGTYSFPTPTTGQGSMLLTAPSRATIALWIASPSEVVGLDVDPSTTQPVILHFEQ